MTGGDKGKVDFTGSGASDPRSMAGRLIATYHRDGVAEPVEASSHWREFLKRFDVEVNEAGEIVRLSGYGFGGSHHTAIMQRTLARLGIELHLATLRIAGLREAVAIGRRVVERMSLAFSHDAFRQVCTQQLLTQSLDQQEYMRSTPSVIAVIGDGHGILSALLHESYPNAQIWLIDLGPTLVFQAFHLSRAFPKSFHILAGERDLSAGPAFVYCPAETASELLPERIDLAVNIASMQEMTIDTVTRYFEILRNRRTEFFYCCNRLEKRLSGGELLRFMEYPWSPKDVHLVDAPAPWHQWFVGVGRIPHVMVCGFPIPFVHQYDGCHWHRLTRLAHAA